jgi:hypothetical protein
MERVMSALVVYESMFGNTKRIADAVADGIAAHLPVETLEVSAAPTEIPPGVELLVVGGPTHAHGMTTVQTRSNAALRAASPLVSRGSGVREWLDTATPQVKATPAAAFDTRIKGPVLLTGSAAGGFAKRLGSAGFRLVAPARSFLVGARAKQDDGLLDGELEAARAWGAALAAPIEAKVRAG